MLLMRAYISKINKWDLLRGIPFGNQKDLWRNELLIDKEAEKKDKVKEPHSVGIYTKSYGGQIHFDIFGIENTRKIIGMDGGKEMEWNY